MQESKIIDFLQQEFPLIGDDAAVFGERQVISKDLLIEDIHFRRKYFDAKSLANKALQVNLSDMAAMGARPLYILLGLAIPQNLTSAYVDEFLNSFTKACRDNNVILIGGDTTASPDKLFISITIIGDVDKVVYRNTANIGDIICYVGNLGYAHIGLQAFEQNIAGLVDFKKLFLQPTALVKAGQDLSYKATAMMDISDGLYIDLHKLCLASGVSAKVNLENFVATDNFTAACKLLKLDPLSVQLMGGEDYGLLFTVKPEQYSSEFKKIGTITAGNGEINFDKKVNLKQKIFSHFGEL